VLVDASAVGSAVVVSDAAVTDVSVVLVDVSAIDVTPDVEPGAVPLSAVPTPVLSNAHATSVGRTSAVIEWFGNAAHFRKLALVGRVGRSQPDNLPVRVREDPRGARLANVRSLRTAFGQGRPSGKNPDQAHTLPAGSFRCAAGYELRGSPRALTAHASYTPRVLPRIYTDTSVLGGCEDDEFRESSRRLMDSFTRAALDVVPPEHLEQPLHHGDGHG